MDSIRTPKTRPTLSMKKQTQFKTIPPWGQFSDLNRDLQFHPSQTTQPN